MDAGSLALDALRKDRAHSVENFDLVAISGEPRQRLERTADGPALPEPGGLGADGNFGTDDANLDIVHAITQRFMDLALDPPLQGGLGGGVRAGLDRDRRLIVIAPPGEERCGKESPEAAWDASGDG